MSHTGFTTATEALDFIFSGKAKPTLTSASGNHFTFKIDAGKDDDIFFVKVLNGPDNSWNGDWQFIGFVKAVAGIPTSCLLAGKKGHPNSTSFKALSWALAHLNRGDIPADLTIQHNDKCGACGRELTDPVSVATGLGPICAGRK